MRPVRWIGLLAVCMLATTAVAAAREHYTGISLETPFPTQTLQLQKQLRIPLTVLPIFQKVLSGLSGALSRCGKAGGGSVVALHD